MSEEKEIFDKKYVYLEWNDILNGKKVVIGDTLGEIRRKLHTGLLDYAEENKGDYPFTRSEDGINFAMCYYDPLYDVKLAWKNGKQIQYRYRGEDDDGWSDTDKPCWDNNTFEYRVKPTSKMWTAVFNDEGVISVMHSSDWSKSKGRQLIEGTAEKCQGYVVENYCDRCACQASCSGQKCTMKINAWYCQGFKELKPELHVCGTCKYKDLPYSCTPCKECMEDDVDSGEKSMWEPSGHKAVRRMTNRELAQWVWQGNGQVKYRDGYYTLIACTAYDIRDDNKPCSDYYVIRGWDETEWHEPEVEEE